MSAKPAINVVSLPRRAKHPRRGSWAGAVDRLDVRVAELERRIADFDRRYAQMTIRTRFGAAGGISLLVHAFVIFGLTFTVPDLRGLQNMAPVLDVVLVNTKSQAKPSKAVWSDCYNGRGPNCWVEPNDYKCSNRFADLATN